MLALKDITFAVEPVIGLALAIHGQRFDLIDSEPYERRDGTPSRLLVWQTECADCHVPFATRSPATQLPGSRRCDACKKPGVRAYREAGRNKR